MGLQEWNRVRFSVSQRISFARCGLAFVFLIGFAGPQRLAAQDLPVAGVSEINPDREPVLEYWTPQRMASAVPMPMLQAGGDPADDDGPVSGVNEPVMMEQRGEDGAGQEVPGQRSTESQGDQVLPPGYSYPYPFTRYDVLPLLYAPKILPTPVNVRATFPYKTVGKVFFILNGKNYVCSASVINPHLLLTARHCIYDYNSHTFATMVKFSPGYYKADNPELGGRWKYRRLYTWVNNAAGHRYDIGFIQLYDDDGIGCGGSRGGRPIESYTSWLLSTWGGSYDSVHWNEFGYPAAAPFTGEVMVEADSSTGTINGWLSGDRDTVAVGNDMTGGSSGGPWLYKMFPGSDTAGVNYANGLNSFYAGGALGTGSPEFFQYNYGTLLTGAKALSCP